MKVISIVTIFIYSLALTLEVNPPILFSLFDASLPCYLSMSRPRLLSIRNYYEMKDTEKVY